MVKLWVMSESTYGVHARRQGSAPLDSGRCCEYRRAQRAISSARKLVGRLPLIMLAGNHEYYRTMETVSQGIARLHAGAARDRKTNRN